ncbi:IclR family transcriptional regulator [Marinobacterium sedimentorum]|uniref:IclR family transcriptional regulator n=1 Tax=Marinobacterium sedimentorum TaxID=2927804 RepID=UPI0020C64CB1|nr:IclR family transcriptional regulator [Marinobacterium sedimentorum]MCP8687586.1 IclR family transcriptional regulator [Marinobacterium sedimentorum]
MAASLITRTLGMIEQLALNPHGLGLVDLAERTAMPKSGAQRLLNDLNQFGYVAQDKVSGDYVLRTRLAALGMQHLANSGFDDVAQPYLDQLAEASGELVRLAVLDGERLVFVAKAQGSARSGLRYDAPSGEVAPLFCTATGFVWLASFSDDEALRIIAAQGPMNLENRGPNVPRTLTDILPHLHAARTQGYSQVHDMSAPGMSAIAVPVTDAGGAKVIGVLAIGGPSARLTAQALADIAPALQQTAKDISSIGVLSEYLRTTKP